MYWPHGLGDFATLSVIAPLFEPSNAYAIARFGDDYTSLFDGDRIFKPLCSGVLKPTDGSFLGARNLGLDIKRCDGREVEFESSAHAGKRGCRIRAGRRAVDGLSGDRRAHRVSVSHEGAESRWAIGEARTIERVRSFAAAAQYARFYRAARYAGQGRCAQLAAFAPPGTKLAILSRTGFTAARKNWGDGSEARAFVETMGKDGWRFISMDDEPLGENAAGFRALFAELNEPFARVYKALAARTSLFTGVPAGPLHVTMARLGIPTVGLWLAHHPDWYDEPNPDAIHLVGRYVRDKGFDKRPATVTKPPSLQHRIVYLDSLEIPANAAVEAARSVRA